MDTGDKIFLIVVLALMSLMLWGVLVRSADNGEKLDQLLKQSPESIADCYTVCRKQDAARRGTTSLLSDPPCK